jgi:GNAT superfamily N-acetyltransferase
MAQQRGGLARLAEVTPVADWAALADEQRVWVATLDDVVVGYLELLVTGLIAEVRQVYVHPEARELGFGDELLATARNAARLAGCTVFEGTALPGDRDTKNLYERAGIVARKIVLSTKL